MNVSMVLYEYYRLTVETVARKLIKHAKIMYNRIILQNISVLVLNI